MNALFLAPPPAFNPRGLPIDRVYGCNYGYDYKPPIHFLQVATYARDVLGWQVRLLDCPAEDLDRAQFEQHVADSHYDVVLCWSTYLSAIEDLAACDQVQRLHPDTRLVFMGAGATWKPDEFLTRPHTWCLLGEPEYTLRDLDSAWRGERTIEGTDGLAWSDEKNQVQRGGIRDLLDVTTLPMPDRRLLRGRYRANRL
ncbi:MAG: cobalamin-dependent protein, partial [Myxococcota bacterium]|nr:cobalamin-dependent protein [Myxococcota bacterium]